ncbi:MAG: hypothetical protein CM1200mP22_32310 [Dehalococcoidia bacterium]|nr:MAG: hypothetical protein CM1200mP22_32310 [Dehalococcoidia bacterium]
MARIPAATRDTVPSGQADAFDELLAGAGSVPLVGPGSIFWHVPKAQQAVTTLNQYLRNDSSLSNKILELTMLVTAREKTACTFGTPMPLLLGLPESPTPLWTALGIAKSSLRWLRMNQLSLTTSKSSIAHTR